MTLENTEAIETLSCQLWDVILQHGDAGSRQRPARWAERISRKVTDLLEPLKLIS